MRLRSLNLQASPWAPRMIRWSHSVVFVDLSSATRAHCLKAQVRQNQNMAVALVFEWNLANLLVVEVEGAVGAGAPRGLDGSSYLAGWGIEQRLGYHRRRGCCHLEVKSKEARTQDEVLRHRTGHGTDEEQLKYSCA